MAFTVDYSDLKQIRKNLEKLDDKLNNNKEVLNLIGVAWVGLVRSNMARNRDVFGTPFIPVNYVKYRYDNGSGANTGKTLRTVNPLRDTGRLIGSISITDVSNNKITIGTPLIYAKTHNEGIGSIRKRTFIPQGSEINRTNFLDKAQEILDNYIKGIVNNG